MRWRDEFLVVLAEQSIMSRAGRSANRLCWLVAAGGALALPACAKNSVMMQSQLKTAEEAQLAMQRQANELQVRASTLDEDNQELSTLLAQAQQQNRALADQLTTARSQLGDANTQLATLRQDFERTTQQATSLAETAKKKTVARITANTTRRGGLEEIDIPGVEVRTDGDVVRIELPGARLFEPGSARLQAGAGDLIDSVTRIVVQNYPQQIIGIEGHTSADAMPAGGAWQSNHQLSSGQAMAVYDHMVTRGRVPAVQLVVVGHGSNHPVVSNATVAGKERNRRVELVIYPETVSGS
jgi:flagellar motor protein MotB